MSPRVSYTDRLVALRSEMERVGTSGDATVETSDEEHEEHPREDPSLGDSQDDLDAEIRRVLLYAMRYGEKRSDKLSAATAAIKYLAVKNRMLPTFGSGLDEEEP